MHIHEVKEHVEYFEAVKDGRKTFELRDNDRNYQEGDLVLLREFDRKEEVYTGRCMLCSIPYILGGADSMYYGLFARHVVFSIEVLALIEEHKP